MSAADIINNLHILNLLTEEVNRITWIRLLVNTELRGYFKILRKVRNLTLLTAFRDITVGHMLDSNRSVNNHITFIESVG